MSSRPQHQPSAVPVDNTVWVGGLVGAVILLTDVISTNWQLVPNIVSMLVVDLALINLFILPGTDAGHVASVLYNELNGKPVAGKARLVLRFLHILGLVVIGIINTVPLCIFHRPRSGKSS